MCSLDAEEWIIHESTVHYSPPEVYGGQEVTTSYSDEWGEILNEQFCEYIQKKNNFKKQIYLRFGNL